MGPKSLIFSEMAKIKLMGGLAWYGSFNEALDFFSDSHSRIQSSGIVLPIQMFINHLEHL